MITRTLALLLTLIAGRMSAQTVADFEEIGMNPSGFQQDASPSTAFASGDVLLPNFWDPVFQYWEGWAISAVKDNKTPGFQNQYSAIPGEGAFGSEHYAVGYVFGEGVIALTDPSRGKPVQGLWVTNSTYAYFSMRDGDAFAKKFGGPSGMDPDFFRVTFRTRLNGVTGADSVTVLTLESSDVGSFGMNTPAYVCIDRVTTAGSTSALDDPRLGSIAMHPNPTSGALQIRGARAGNRVEILDMQGRQAASTVLSAEGFLDVSYLPSGSYLLRLVQPDGVSEGWLLKR